MAELIIAFAAGAVAGILALLWHQRSVNEAVRREQSRAAIEQRRLAEQNRRLHEDMDALQRCMDSRDSYRQGVQDGEQRQQHKDNVTRFADSLERNGRATMYSSGRESAR